MAYVTIPVSSAGGGSCDFNDSAPASLRTVRLAATTNLDLSGAETIDSTATNVDDRIGVFGQTTKSQNGIYLVAAGAWTRVTDFDGDGEVEAGTAIYVTSGNIWRRSAWKVTNLGAISIGTTSLVIVPVSVDFTPDHLFDGTQAQIGVARINFVNGAGASDIVGVARCFSTVFVLQSLAAGIWIGGVGYKALADTVGWTSLHGGQGKPTGIPENLDVAGQKGAVAERYDVTGYRRYGYDTETNGAVTPSWKCYARAYSFLKRGTNLTDADQTLQPVTDTASEYCQFTALTSNRVKTLGVTSTFAGQSVRILRADGAAFTEAIVNGGGGAGTLFTFASGQGTPTAPFAAWFKSDGTNWALDKLEYVEA